MSKVMDEISEELAEFIRAQRVFFVATAPLSADGHVNLSPKGLDTFRILWPKRVAYADMTGSGNETSAHLAENGRVTLMFCGFDDRPKILRIYGRGRTVLRGAHQWRELAAPFEELMSLRQMIVVDVTRVATSCGFGVPLMTFIDERGLLQDWAMKKGKDGLKAYRREKNLHSIDGLIAPLAAENEAE
jgi:predicted pyridoxine 5'-phosphate oxidase superfamily flavin-nucleotide-binding protein